MTHLTATDTPEEGSDPSVRLTRRQRQRRAFLAEIGDATRSLIVEASADGTSGLESVTMSAVAERLGVSAPALYRYVDGRTGLVELACATIATELTAHMQKFRAELDPEPLAQVVGLFRELRRWALAHRAEFAVLFAHPATAYMRDVRPGMSTMSTDATETAANRAAAAALELTWLFSLALLRLWVERPFPVPDDNELPEGLSDSLARFIDSVFEQAAAAGIDVGAEPPVGGAAVMLSYWVRVYGMISMEVFGHLSHAVIDGGPLLEYVLDELTRMVGPAPDA